MTLIPPYIYPKYVRLINSVNFQKGVNKTKTALISETLLGKLSKFPGLLIVLVLLLNACSNKIVQGSEVVQGSGIIISESSNVSGFERISLSGSGVVIITQSGEETLSVETGDNIMQYVKTEVREGALYLNFDAEGTAGVSPTRTTFTLSVKQLNGLSVFGSVPRSRCPRHRAVSDREGW